MLMLVNARVLKMRINTIVLVGGWNDHETQGNGAQMQLHRSRCKQN